METIYHIHPLGEFQDNEYRAVLLEDSLLGRLNVEIQRKGFARSVFGKRHEKWEMVIWDVWLEKDALEVGHEYYELMTIKSLWKRYKKRARTQNSLVSFLETDHELTFEEEEEEEES